MMALLRCIESDFYKLRHTPILWLHLLIPMAGALLFLGYYATSSWNVSTKISGYLETLAVVFPLLIGLMSALVIAQEEQAGNFQTLLCGTKSKFITYLSKLIVLLLLGSFSIALAVGTFALVFQTAALWFYLKATGVLVVGNIFLYILHVFVSLQFGRGASIGLGIWGSLVSALMLTGLGDKIWCWTPWAWGGRLCDYLVLEATNPSAFTMVSSGMYKGILTMILFVGLSALASLLWFRQWEGRRSYD